MTIYTTNSWGGYHKGDSYHNEYRLEGGRVDKVKVSEGKFLDGKENVRTRSERVTDSWSVDDVTMPAWLRKHIK